MKCAAYSLIAMVLAMVIGCGDNSKSGQIKLGGESAEVRQARAVQNADAQKQDDDQVIPPADAVWTIICAQFKGNSHVETSKIYKQQIVAKTGWKGFYLVHDDEGSSLFYGYYRAIDPRGDDAAEGQRAQADLQKVRSLQNSVGDPLFRMAGMQPLEPVDPPAPPEWNLLNVDRGKPDNDPTKAYWSLEIAIYKDSPLRKQAAVDSVRELREKLGIKDAYYFHGKTVSSVCIGTWPESAVVQKEPERGGSDDRVVVLPPGMPPDMVKGNRDETGHAIRVVTLSPVPVDPTLIDMMTKYERRSVNGYDIKHTVPQPDGHVAEVYDPSQVIFIPRPENAGMLGSDQREGTIQQPTRPAPALPGGRLRSLDGSGGAQ